MDKDTEKRPRGLPILKKELRQHFERQRHAAFAINVNESYLSDVLNGWKNPGKRFRIRVCELLGKKEEELFTN